MPKLRSSINLTLAAGVVVGALLTSALVAGAAATGTTTPAPGGECREIVHELGTACVPAEPQRIVVLDSLMVLPTLLEAGAPVVGALSVYEVGEPFPTFVTVPEGFAIVGSLQNPNLEAIAAAEPDLILGADITIAPIQADLELIAPTVATKYTYYVPTWREDALLAADAAGVRAEVQTSIDALDARIAETNARLTADGDGPTLSRVDVFNGMPLYYQFACTAFGSVLLDAGVRQPAAQVAECTPNDYASVLMYPSLEELDVLDGDVIVTYQQQAAGDDVGASPLDVLASNQLWATLSAVQAGNVHVVGDAWGLGASAPAFQLMLDDVDALFP